MPNETGIEVKPLNASNEKNWRRAPHPYKVFIAAPGNLDPVLRP
jgi:hypothetical protein